MADECIAAAKMLHEIVFSEEKTGHLINTQKTKLHTRLLKAQIFISS